MRSTLQYLEEHQPQHVESALEAFRCFEPYAEDAQSYARSTRWVPSGCEQEVVDLLRNLNSSGPVGGTGRDAQFNATRNARSAAGAEAYYRAMVQGGPESWNIRDRHMAETLDALMDHHGPHSKAIVWEHNTHIGDARWTDMAAAGMVNVGQLVREKHSEDGVILVGFGSRKGHVLAADRWGGHVAAMPVPAARDGSIEQLLHDALTERESALFVFNSGETGWAGRSRAHRAIGVVYHPDAERQGNYVPTVLNRRYDAFLWIDQTTPLVPLAATGQGLEMATWPTGD